MSLRPLQPTTIAGSFPYIHRCSAGLCWLLLLRMAAQTCLYFQNLLDFAAWSSIASACPQNQLRATCSGLKAPELLCLAGSFDGIVLQHHLRTMSFRRSLSHFRDLTCSNAPTSATSFSAAVSAMWRDTLPLRSMACSPGKLNKTMSADAATALAAASICKIRASAASQKGRACTRLI